MKITFIEPAGKGGMIHYAFQLCRALGAAGADVTLVTERNFELASLPRTFAVQAMIDLWDPKPPGRLSEAPWAVTWRKLRRVTRAFRYYAEWLRIIRYVRRSKPDVVILGDIRFAGDLFPLLLLKRVARQLVDICHNVRPFAAGGKAQGLFDRSRFRRFFYRFIYRLFDVVFVHFKRNRDEFITTFGVSPERVGVIVHGNEEIFRELARPDLDAAALRSRLQLPPTVPIVLFFGTLSRYKGTDTLLESFPLIQRETGARLVLAGYPFHDFDVAAHKELARGLGISDAVTWVPEYILSEEVAAWMALASVIVFPYRDIYQSGALHVAQTFGVPTVATAIGAMQDVIQHEWSGLLVPKDDRGALSEAIIRLLHDPDLARRLSAHAREDAQGPFSWRTIADLMLAKLRTRTGA